MTDSQKPERPSRRPGDKRPSDRRPSSGGAGRPRRDGDARPARDKPRDGAKPGERSGPRRPSSERPRDGERGKPRDGQRSAERSTGSRDSSAGGPRRSFAKPGASDRPRPHRDGAKDPRPRESEEPRHDDPPVDDDALPTELDRQAWRELKALTKENAEWVAGHLVMANRVVDEDPARAHQHAQAAARRAGRIPVVRETLGITAYLVGDFALALRELRTYRRLSGSNEQLPLMVDCERGLGRPQKALELAGDVDRASLTSAVQVELAIARSGARLDLGQPELALAELEIPQLTPNTVYSFSPALFDSYAVVLSELGREAEAEAWGQRADEAASALAEARELPEEDTVVVVEIPEDTL